jgi:hypothetical protein
MARKQKQPGKGRPTKGGQRWTAASVISNPLDTEMRRFVLIRHNGNSSDGDDPVVLEVVIPAGGKLKIRDVLAELPGKNQLLTVSPPGMTRETLEQIAAAAEATLTPFEMRKQEADKRASGAD